MNNRQKNRFNRMNLTSYDGKLGDKIKALEEAVEKLNKEVFKEGDGDSEVIDEIIEIPNFEL